MCVYNYCVQYVCVWLGDHVYIHVRYDACVLLNVIFKFGTKHIQNTSMYILNVVLFVVAATFLCIVLCVCVCLVCVQSFTVS